MITPSPSATKRIALAKQMTEDPKVLARWSEEGPTLGWYSKFMKRANVRHPDLKQVLERASNGLGSAWFNTNNVKFWFGHLYRVGLQRGHLMVNDAGRYQWTNLQRIFFSDETVISGDQYRKASNGKRSVVAQQKNLSYTDKGKPFRFIPDNGEGGLPHITFVASHTGEGIGPLAVVVAGATSTETMRVDTRKKLENAVPVYPVFPRVNNHMIDTPIIASSAKGSVTTDNIKEIFSKMILQAYPDVADEPGKRVLWFLDGGPGRFSEEFLIWTRSKGVDVHGYLPNLTSKFQTLDVKIFGKVKCKLDKGIANWRVENPAKALDKYTLIRMAAAILIAVVTQPLVKEALEMVGLGSTLDEAVLLSNPAIADGDMIRDASDKTIAASTMAQ